MQEFFFTILSIWLIWRLFDAFSGSRKTSQTYQQTTNHYYSKKQAENSFEKEGNVRVETKKKPATHIPPDEGEYVDYEEVTGDK